MRFELGTFITVDDGRVTVLEGLGCTCRTHYAKLIVVVVCSTAWILTNPEFDLMLAEPRLFCIPYLRDLQLVFCMHFDLLPALPMRHTYPHGEAGRPRTKTVRINVGAAGRRRAVRVDVIDRTDGHRPGNATGRRLQLFEQCSLRWHGARGARVLDCCRMPVARRAGAGSGCADTMHTWQHNNACGGTGCGSPVGLCCCRAVDLAAHGWRKRPPLDFSTR